MTALPLLSLLTGTLLSALLFKTALWLAQKVRTPLFNPLLISALFCIFFLVVTRTPLETYQQSVAMLSFFLGPATVALGYAIYLQRQLLKKHFIPICAGCLVGSIVSMVSAYGLSKAFGLEESLALSVVPKSVTMPIAISVAQELGGMSAITVAAVIMTGILGAVFAPVLIKIFRIQHPITKGIAIGTASHAIGTTKALEMGELEGAMSGVAIGISGLLTTFLVIIAKAIGIF